MRSVTADTLQSLSYCYYYYDVSYIVMQCSVSGHSDLNGSFFFPTIQRPSRQTILIIIIVAIRIYNIIYAQDLFLYLNVIGIAFTYHTIMSTRQPLTVNSYYIFIITGYEGIKMKIKIIPEFSGMEGGIGNRFLPPRNTPLSLTQNVSLHMQLFNINDK